MSAGGAGRLTILMAMHSMTARTGGQLHVRDASVELVRRGHSVILWSATDGGVVDEVRAEGVIVVHHLDDVPAPPTVIYGHTTGETVAAALRFDTVPTVFYCHGLDDWTTVPPQLAIVRRFLCTGDHTRRRIEGFGVDPSRVEILPNAVDLDRFLPRPPLPERPMRALVIGTAPHLSDVAPIAALCDELGIELELVGGGFGTETDHPEQAMARSDVVFASARSALEAMATGCAVIVWHPAGMGDMVTTETLDDLRAVNVDAPCYVRARSTGSPASWTSTTRRVGSSAFTPPASCRGRTRCASSRRGPRTNGVPQPRCSCTGSSASIGLAEAAGD